MDFNKIRNGFRDEMTALKPLLHAAYRSIHAYQMQRNSDKERCMRGAIAETAAILRSFIGHIPPSKGKYIAALQWQEEMTSSDLIMCFDQAVYELHLWTMLQELGIKKGRWARGRQPWSRELRALLDERRFVDKNEDEGSQPPREERFKASGTPACRGTAQGAACIVHGKDDFHKVKAGMIVVTGMSTPDFTAIAGLMAGLVTDRGGVLCHAAILAREYNIPCVVGCLNATESIADGEWIRLDAVSGVIMGT